VAGVTVLLHRELSGPELSDLFESGKVSLENALKRNARLLRAAEKIKVEISGSKVILRGSVGSWADYEEAEYAAYCAPGVSEGENKLAVTG
jgi:osmotically-inducible protein OsmY